MNILITGANGQLGSEIRELNSKGLTPKELNFIYTDVDELDITDLNAIESFFRDKKIDIIINCAAYTAVDKAESDEKKAGLINITAPKNLSIIANKYQARIVHVSTDFIFDGKSSIPYKESDKPNPLSVYGKTKLEGEREIINNSNNFIIIRTSWLYSSNGSNFVKTVRRLASEKGNLKVIYDQTGTPTYARDLAKAILDILPKLKDKNGEIYHYSNEGLTSWYDFAKAICEFSKIECEILPIEAKDYPTPAKRPHYSVLNKDKIKKDFGIAIPYWRDSLKECIEKLENSK